MIPEHLYTLLAGRKMTPWEQKGYARGTQGANHYIHFDRAVMKDSKPRKTHLAMRRETSLEWKMERKDASGDSPEISYSTNEDGQNKITY